MPLFGSETSVCPGLYGGRSVSRLVGLSGHNFSIGRGRFHFHAPVGAFVYRESLKISFRFQKMLVILQNFTHFLMGNISITDLFPRALTSLQTILNPASPAVPPSAWSHIALVFGLVYILFFNC